MNGLSMRLTCKCPVQAKPGKKGISLTKDQADNLLAKLDDLSGALGQRQETSFALGPKYESSASKCILIIISWIFGNGGRSRA